MDVIGIVLSDISLGRGTERAVTNLANGLSQEKEKRVIIISVYSSAGKDTPYFPLHERIKTIHLGMKRDHSLRKRIVTYRHLVNQLQSVINAEGIDFILGTIHAYNILITFLNNVIKIGCEHMIYSACPKYSKVARKMAYKKLNAVVLLTKGDAAHYKFIKNEKIRVIPNSRSFECENIAELNEKTIISAGGLEPIKGYDILLEMAKGLKEDLPGWEIQIYGNGEDKTKLVETIQKYGLENMVKILEPVSNFRDKLLKASIYLMTSRHEGFGMVLLEAQTCGIPVVAFDCEEGPGEIIRDGENGFLIPLFDLEGMREKIKLLAQDTELRRRLGKNAYDNSNRFSTVEVMRKWDRLFDDLKEGKRC